MVMTIERARAMWVIGAGKLKDVALWKDRVHLWECAHLCRRAEYQDARVSLSPLFANGR